MSQDVAASSTGFLTRIRISPPRRRNISVGNIIIYVCLTVLAIAWLIPVLWALATSLKFDLDAAAVPVSWFGTHGITFDAFAKVFANGKVPLWAWNSLFTSAIVTIITVAVSALAGYALSRIPFAGKRYAYAVVIAAIIVPAQILIVPLFYELVSLNMIDTYWGIILPQVVAPAMVYILKRFFDALPHELEDAATVDGASRLRVFWSIVLPLSRPILAAVSIFVFITAWNNFLVPFLVVNNESLMTLPVGLQTIKSAYGIQWAQNMASAILAAAPLIIVFLFFQRQIVRGATQTGFSEQ